MIHITVDESDFSIEQQLSDLRTFGDTGAVASFIGLVRDTTNSDLEYMYLECYTKMAHQSLHDIAQLASHKWNINNIVIYHRIGKLLPTEQIVLVIATSKHREDAFNACWFIMDYLKTDAPFWKKECSKDSTKWVEVHNKDVKAKHKWRT